MKWGYWTLWPPRGQMAFFALLASIIGAASFTILSGWVVWILWRGGWTVGTEARRLDALAYANYAYIAVAAITISALGMAINRRSLKVAGPGGTSVEMGGGDVTSDDSVTITEVKP